MDDLELLRQYAGDHSEGAFRALVQRYLPLVYSAALRQVGERGLAEDVTQVVFILLARKAGKLPTKTLLAGWLYRTTRHTATKALRNEYRRRRREQEALAMQTAESNTGWEQLAPFLDEAMAQLGELDRGALLLRYFQNKSLREVGCALGVNEDAAQKRVSRAVGKLRRLLLQRGVAVSAVVVTGLLATHAAQFAPEGLAGSVAAAALSQAGFSTSVYALLQELVRQSLWPKLALRGAVALTTVASSVAAVHFWPQPKPAAVSYTFQSQIIQHPRPAPRLAVKQAPIPVPSAPATDLASAPPTELPVAPRRPAVLPVRPVLVKAAVGTNAPRLQAAVAAGTPGSPDQPADDGQAMPGQVPAPGPYSAYGMSLSGNRFGPAVSQGAAGLAGGMQPVMLTNRPVWAPAQVWRPVRRAGAPMRVTLVGGAPQQR